MALYLSPGELLSILLYSLKSPLEQYKELNGQKDGKQQHSPVGISPQMMRKWPPYQVLTLILICIRPNIPPRTNQTREVGHQLISLGADHIILQPAT